MKATARPMTLYFERKSMNSFHKPLGGGGGGGVGLGSSNSLMRLSSSSIFSSLDIAYHKNAISVAFAIKICETNDTCGNNPFVSFRVHA